MEGCKCQHCGQYYRVDFVLDDDIWNKIRPQGKPEGGGLLCGLCIFERLEALGFGAFLLNDIS